MSNNESFNEFNSTPIRDFKDLAERLGKPYYTVRSWARKGQLAGVTREGFRNYSFNLEEIGVVGPKWSQTLHRQLITTEGSHEQQGSCLYCGNRLTRKAKVWCTHRCQGEQTQQLNWERRNGVEDPFKYFPPSFRRNFQEWMNISGVGFLQRRSFYVANDGRFVRKVDQDTEVDEDLFEKILVSDFPGYLVPPEYFTFVLGLPPSEENIAMVREKMASYKNKLRDSEEIFSAGDEGREFAWGSGIESFSLSFLELQVLRQLWIREEAWVSRGFISYDLTGSANRRDSIDTTQQAVVDLSEHLKDSIYKIILKSKKGAVFLKLTHK